MQKFHFMSFQASNPVKTEQRATNAPWTPACENTVGKKNTMLINWVKLRTFLLQHIVLNVTVI